MIIEKLLEHPIIYTIWQKPHDKKKAKIILKEINLKEATKILDVGCGPGINSNIFKGKEYLGVDINAKYIDYCRKKFRGMDFRTLDIRTAKLEKVDFDWVLMSGFLHHISDKDVLKVFAGVKRNMKIRGRILVIDLLIPSKSNILGGMFVALDRGHFPRKMEEFHYLFSKHFEVEKSYTIRIWFWDMCVFVCKKTEK